MLGKVAPVNPPRYQESRPSKQTLFVDYCDILKQIELVSYFLE